MRMLLALCLLFMACDSADDRPDDMAYSWVCFELGGTKVLPVEPNPPDAGDETCRQVCDRRRSEVGQFASEIVSCGFVDTTQGRSVECKWEGLDCP